MSSMLQNLLNGLNRGWTKIGQYWKTPTNSSISEARQRLGCQVMSQLLARLAVPQGTLSTVGTFLRGLRVMAVDGTVLDVPDSKANAKVFGSSYAVQRGQEPPLFKVRVVLLKRSRNPFNYRCFNVIFMALGKE